MTILGDIDCAKQGCFKKTMSSNELRRTTCNKKKTNKKNHHQKKPKNPIFLLPFDRKVSKLKIVINFSATAACYFLFF